VAPCKLTREILFVCRDRALDDTGDASHHLENANGSTDARHAVLSDSRLLVGYLNLEKCVDES
jgi:hypothetical protein